MHTNLIVALVLAIALVAAIVSFLGVHGIRHGRRHDRYLAIRRKRLLRTDRRREADRIAR